MPILKPFEVKGLVIKVKVVKIVRHEIRRC